MDKQVSRVTTKILHAIVFSKNPQSSASFYSTVLNLKVKRQSKLQIELMDQDNMKVILRKTENEAYASTGYCPMLCFRVESVDYVKSQMSYFNLTIDSKAGDTDKGKLITFRGPDNVMLSVTDMRETESDDEQDEEKTNDNEEGFTSDQIRDILRRIKY